MALQPSKLALTNNMLCIGSLESYYGVLLGNITMIVFT